MIESKFEKVKCDPLKGSYFIINFSTRFFLNCCNCKIWEHAFGVSMFHQTISMNPLILKCGILKTFNSYGIIQIDVCPMFISEMLCFRPVKVFIHCIFVNIFVNHIHFFFVPMICTYCLIQSMKSHKAFGVYIPAYCENIFILNFTSFLFYFCFINQHKKRAIIKCS